MLETENVGPCVGSVTEVGGSKDEGGGGNASLVPLAPSGYTPVCTSILVIMFLWILPFLSKM